jgi:hypothetical protein
MELPVNEISFYKVLLPEHILVNFQISLGNVRERNLKDSSSHFYFNPVLRDPYELPLKLSAILNWIDRFQLDQMIAISDKVSFAF